MRELKGSEKQIAWAEKILAKFEENLESGKAEAKENFATMFDADEVGEFEPLWDRFVAFMRNCDNASFIIDQRHNIENPAIGFDYVPMAICKIIDGEEMAYGLKWAEKIAMGE